MIYFIVTRSSLSYLINVARIWYNYLKFYFSTKESSRTKQGKICTAGYSHIQKYWHVIFDWMASKVKDHSNFIDFCRFKYCYSSTRAWRVSQGVVVTIRHEPSHVWFTSGVRIYEVLTVFSCLPWRHTSAQHSYNTSHVWQLWHNAGICTLSHHTRHGSRRYRYLSFSTLLQEAFCTKP